MTATWDPDDDPNGERFRTWIAKLKAEKEAKAKEAAKETPGKAKPAKEQA